MFSVYTLHIAHDGKVTISRARKGLTCAEAKAWKATRLTCKVNTCSYHVVNDERLDIFKAWAYKQGELLRKAEAERQKRWQYAERMAWKGYKCADVIAFINQ